MSDRDVGEVRVPHGVLATAAGLLFIIVGILWLSNAIHRDCESQRCVAGKPTLLQGTCFCVQPATATEIKP